MRSGTNTLTVVASLTLAVAQPAVAQPVDDQSEPPADVSPTSEPTPGTTADLPMGRLVFDSDMGGDGLDLWMLEAGTPSPLQITSGDGRERTPALSPDGTRVAFSTDRFEGTRAVGLPRSSLAGYDIYTIAIDGSDAKKVVARQGFKSGPDWSPDGSMLAYGGEVDGPGGTRIQVHVVPADGSDDPLVLTDDPVQADGPAWSPDGSRIAFTTLRHGQNADGGWNREIYVMAADGSDQVRLTDHPANDGSPAWSPDGTRIAFSSDRTGDEEIHVMAADGSEVVRLTHSAEPDDFPAWSPDGSMIAFVSQRDGDRDIYLMNADGSDQVPLTDNREDFPGHRGADDFPSWGPLGSLAQRAAVDDAAEPAVPSEQVSSPEPSIVPAEEAARSEASEATVRAGSCAAPGAVIAELADVTSSSEEAARGTTSEPAPVQAELLAGVSVIPISRDELIGRAHHIALADATGEVVLCGDIGGSLAGDVVPVALLRETRTDLVGLATLQPLEGGSTRVSVYAYPAVQDAEGPVTTSAPDAAAVTRFELDVDLHFGGWDVTVEDVRYDPAEQDLAIDAVMTNRSGRARRTVDLYRGTQAFVTASDGQIHRLVFDENVPVPAGQSTRGSLVPARALPEDFTLEGAELDIGGPEFHQASVPLRPGATGASFTPIELDVSETVSLAEVGSIDVDGIQVIAATCRGNPDELILGPAQVQEVSLILEVASATGSAERRQRVDSSIRQADGTSVVGDPGRVILPDGQVQRGLRLCYTVASPPEGEYAVVFESGDQSAGLELTVSAR